MNYKPENVWLGEEIDELKRLAAAGLSASRIGDQLGKSKGSVIGKMNRLGITKAPVSVTLKERPSKPKPPPPQVPKPPPPRPAPPPKRDLLADMDRIGTTALFALQEGECKWPVGQPGTPDFQFCAAKQLDGYVYCKLHAMAAFGWDE
jgi:GcrA cell cycle regulator